MKQKEVEIQIDASGLDSLIEKAAKRANVSIIKGKKNLDGALIFSIVGTAVSVASFCLDLYRTVREDKKVRYISKDCDQEGMTLDRAADQATYEATRNDHDD